MSTVLYHPETDTVTGAEHLVISEYPRYVELLDNPRKVDGEWRAVANVDQQLCIVVVSLKGMDDGRTNQEISRD